MFVAIYRLMEVLDGERRLKIIPYRTAQKIKVFCLTFIN
jgi:hypothetical protein